jgi:DNA-binding IclR family transcriptional regulator
VDNASQKVTGVKSGHRVIRILEYFRHNPQPVRNIELAQSLSLPMSSANELLKTLVDDGYLVFDTDSKRYTLSMQLITLADAVVAHDPAIRASINAAQVLHKRTGESVGLLVRNGRKMQFVYRICGAYNETGSQVPIIGTSAGGALLMSMPSPEVLNIARRIIHCTVPTERQDAMKKLSSKIMQFRSQGFALSDHTAHPPGVRVIAIPLSRSAMQPAVCLGMGGRDIASELSRTKSAQSVAKMMKDVIHGCGLEAAQMVA